MNKHFSTIFFDLGSTLIYSKEPWQPIFAKAELALLDSLQENGIQLDKRVFETEQGGFITSYYANRGDSTTEKTSFIALREILASRGLLDVPDNILRSALDAMYSTTQQNWFLEDDAISTLDQLRVQGFQLGLISNTSDDKNVQQLVDRCGLRSFFPCVITSAGIGIRKPDSRIFQLGLDYFHILPGEAVMVGDTLEADILGANLMGIYSIWITRRVNLQGINDLSIQPQAIVSSLSQVPGIMSEIGAEKTPL